MTVGYDMLVRIAVQRGATKYKLERGDTQSLEALGLTKEGVEQAMAENFIRWCG